MGIGLGVGLPLLAALILASIFLSKERKRNSDSATTYGDTSANDPTLVHEKDSRSFPQYSELDSDNRDVLE